MIPQRKGWLTGKTNYISLYWPRSISLSLSSTHLGFVSQTEIILCISYLFGRLVYQLHFCQLCIETVCWFSCYVTWTLLKKPFVYRLPWWKVSRVYNAVHKLIELKSFPAEQGMCSSVVLPSWGLRYTGVSKYWHSNESIVAVFHFIRTRQPGHQRCWLKTHPTALARYSRQLSLKESCSFPDLLKVSRLVWVNERVD